MTSPVTHTPPYRHPSAEFNPAGRTSSDYLPKYAQTDSPPDALIATHGKSSPDDVLIGTGSPASSELLRSFSNMHVAASSQSVQRALFPSDSLRLQNSSGQAGSPQRPSPSPGYQTSLGITQANGPLTNLVHHSSFGRSDSHQPALHHQAGFCQGSTPQGSPMPQNSYTQPAVHHQASFPQETTPLRGLIHNQSSLNSNGSYRGLGHRGSFTQGIGESGVLSSHRGLGHQDSFTHGSSESGVLRQHGSFGGGNSPDADNDATVRRIQEAAVDRQELLSLTPITTPVGGSRGQAPVLRHMNVSQIAPNRVCCNALLAAYARAKPTCWQKVSAICCQCCCIIVV